MFSIYAIENINTHQQYIGMTARPPKRRFTEHCGKRKTVISSAIRNVGKKNFRLKVLAQTTDYMKARALELKNIILLDTVAPHGFNIQCGGALKDFFYAERTGQLTLDL